jgi:hypothetical protein
MPRWKREKRGSMVSKKRRKGQQRKGEDEASDRGEGEGDQLDELEGGPTGRPWLGEI